MRLSCWVVLGFVLLSTCGKGAASEVIGSEAHKAAKVAIEDHNKEMNTDLEFVSIEKAVSDYSNGIKYLLVKVKEHSGIHMLFQTAVRCIPTISFCTSTGLEYAGEAQPGASLHYPPKPLLLEPQIRPIAEFAVHNHNLKLNSELDLEEIVSYAQLDTLLGQYSTCIFSLTVYDRSQDKHFLVKTQVVKHNFERQFYESTQLEFISQLHPPQTPPPPLSPPLIKEDTKMVAEFAVESHNVKMGTHLEFVDQVGTGMDTQTNGEGDYTYQITIQVIDHLDQGKSKIFKALVQEHYSGRNPELTEFQFVSYTQPRPRAETAMEWVSPTLLSKAQHKFHNGLADKHKQLTTRRLSTIAHYLKTGENINLESVPFLWEATYNLTNSHTIFSMIAELTEFVPFCDGVAASYKVLFPILTTLAKFEDPFARETAVTLFCRVGEHMTQKDVLLWFIPLVKALATGESYAGRVSSTGLFQIAYLSATAEFKAELRLLYRELRRDKMAVVRTAAASNLGKFAAVDGEVAVLGGARAIAQGIVQNLYYHSLPAFLKLQNIPFFLFFIIILVKSFPCL